MMHTKRPRDGLRSLLPVPTGFWSIFALLSADDPHSSNPGAVSWIQKRHPSSRRCSRRRTLLRPTPTQRTHRRRSARRANRAAMGAECWLGLGAPRVFRLAVARAPHCQHGPWPCVPGLPCELRQLRVHEAPRSWHASIPRA
jgi:hypothetical protein